MVSEADVLDLLDTFDSSRDWLMRSVCIAEKEVFKNAVKKR